MRLVGLVVLVNLVSACGFEVVDTGHRGLFVRFGEVDNEVLTEGIYFFNPFTTGVKELDIRIQKAEYQSHTYTKDVQVAVVKSTMTYSLEPEVVAQAYKAYGHEWGNKILPQAVEGSLKSIIGTWDAVDLIANRDKAREAVEKSLKTSVSKLGIKIQTFDLVNIDYNDAFEKAVEAKVIATQRAIEAKNKTRQIREEANQRILSAEAEAKSMKIRAKALQQNKGLVEYEAVQKWNGVLPHTIMGAAPIPFLNLQK